MNRIKADRALYKAEVKRLESENKALSARPAPIEDKVDLVFVSLQLFLSVGLGFRAVSRVLDFLCPYLGLKKAPCAQTIINWVTRLSILRLQNQVQRCVSLRSPLAFSNGQIWIMDISIGLGAGKILTILGLNAEHHALHPGAPTLSDVSCLAVAVSVSWTGEKIAEFLSRVIAVYGRPLAYLKDGGCDLSKSVRLLTERGMGSDSISDVSHAIANLLKHEYQNHPLFQTFLSACGKASKALKQTILASLTPPKVSTKARFMNLHRLIKWANKILKHSPKGRAAKNSKLEKLRKSLGKLPECKAFIQRFLRDVTLLLECQKIIKTEGLSVESYQTCLPYIQQIPAKSSVRAGILQWFDQQLIIAKRLQLQSIGMPITSDSIESLFGIAKKRGTGAIQDAHRIALRIPAMCGYFTKQEAQLLLDISCREQQEIEKTLPSLTQQRREILPTPGSLENIQDSTDTNNGYFELIPRPKTRSNNVIYLNISNTCMNNMGPPKTVVFQA